MEQSLLNSSTKFGTIGGTLLVLLVRVNLSDLATSAILAALSATVSFTVSLLLRLLLKCFKRKSKT